MRRIEKGATYRHFKGNYYEVLELAYDATNGSKSDKMMVVYKDLASNKVYVRDFKEFESEVDRRKYPDVEQRWRFERVNLNKRLKTIDKIMDVLSEEKLEKLASLLEEK